MVSFIGTAGSPAVQTGCWKQNHDMKDRNQQATQRRQCAEVLLQCLLHSFIIFGVLVAHQPPSLSVPLDSSPDPAKDAPPAEQRRTLKSLALLKTNIYVWISSHFGTSVTGVCWSKTNTVQFRASDIPISSIYFFLDYSTFLLIFAFLNF